LSLHPEALKTSCGCPVGTCKAELRIYLKSIGKDFTGLEAEQSVSALGEMCVWYGKVPGCPGLIDNLCPGHVCNCVGPEHEDCNPDRD
jgi:hypothetical protein